MRFLLFCDCLLENAGDQPALWTEDASILEGNVWSGAWKQPHVDQICNKPTELLLQQVLSPNVDEYFKMEHI
jgi:hypothetical protein